jgi:hypothetical protein
MMDFRSVRCGARPAVFDVLERLVEGTCDRMDREGTG